jgi:hypothetical protein
MYDPGSEHCARIGYMRAEFNICQDCFKCKLVPEILIWPVNTDRRFQKGCKHFNNYDI